MAYFRSSIVVTILGLILSAVLGWFYLGTLGGILQFLFFATVLAILEVSLSFDNAVVNAKVLKSMTPLWQHRFLTWGMIIAVFGMRLVFPLLLVGVVGQVGIWDALVMAATDPKSYSDIMLKAHVPIAGFGGAFLLLVALAYFFDHEKDLHWVHFIEAPLSRLGRMRAVEIAVALIIILLFSKLLQPNEQMVFLTSSAWGIVTYLLVDGIGAVLKMPTGDVNDVHRASAGMFLYLEVLDASFSFDGVVGAFAITNNLFIIIIGLGIGAMFVRSLTIMLVEKNTLASYQYLEHGAFYAIFALSVIMFANTVFHIPEVVSGILGAGFIAISLWDSVRRPGQHQSDSK